MSRMQIAKALRDQGASYDEIAERMQIAKSAARAYVWRAENPAETRNGDRRRHRRYAKFGNRELARIASREAYANARLNGLSPRDAQKASAAAYQAAMIRTYAPNLRAFVEASA